MPSNVNEVTNPRAVYLRLHGRNAKAYVTGKTVAARFDYDYSDKEIAEVAKRSKKLVKEAREAHVIFNNNNLDYAPRAGLRLRKALGQIEIRSEEHTSELQSRSDLVCRLLLEKKKNTLSLIAEL